MAKGKCMKNKLFNRTAKKHLRKNPRERRFVNYTKADNILLLFESDGSSDIHVREIVKALKNDKKNVVAWGFFNSKNPVESNSFDIKLFNKKSINVFQKPNKEILKEISTSKFDLLIDLSINTTIPLMYISLLTNANMKISSKITDQRLFDFILDINKLKEESLRLENSINEQFLFNEINFYLKSIQTTD